MPLERKIGQMFMGNICGGESVELARRLLDEFGFGGLQFSGIFERFVRGGDYLPCGVDAVKPLATTAAFLGDIHKASMDILGVPAIMGGDQEGGMSSSIFRRRNVSIMPHQMGIGASDDADLAYRCAKVTAREMRLLGLDMLYGPSLDVNTNPKNPEIGPRSFGDDPEACARFGEAVIRAYREENVIATAKHFPGRGHGQSNAHAELESIDVDRARLDAVELLPFRRAIAAGVDSIMLAHTLFPAVEPDRVPASLSKRIVTDLLRGELGFDGLVIPDTLTMFAISKNFEVPRAAAMCLEAGADMIFMKVTELYGACIEAIKESVKAGRLTEERIDDSVRRILTLKRDRGLFERATPTPEEVNRVVGCDEHAATAREAARRAIVTIKNEGGTLPLKRDTTPSVLCVIPRDMNVVMANDPTLSHDMLQRHLAHRLPDVQTVLVDERPNTPQRFEAVGRSKNVDAVIFGIYSGGMSQEQETLLKEIVTLGKTVIVVIGASPYVANRVPAEVKAIVCGFSVGPYVMEALAGVLTGGMEAGGTMPVSL